VPKNKWHDIQLKAQKLNIDQKVDSCSSCSNSSTCCKTSNDTTACCPYQDGTCCGPHGYCCPKEYTCDPVKETCVYEDPDKHRHDDTEQEVEKVEPSKISFKKKRNEIFKKFKLLTSSGEEQCADDIHLCEENHSCCQSDPKNGFGCCPIGNVCILYLYYFNLKN
jgi:hypothetical protein